MNVLITGAAGFIGSALCSRLASGNKVIGVDIAGPSDGALNIAWEQADLTDWGSAVAICEKYSPDVVIHCAGIAHQKIGAVDSATYMRVNSEATENLAKAAAESNPNVCFFFFSSVSVYGEGPQMPSRKGAKALKTKNSNNGVSEDGECWPSSDYAVSKLDAERRLVALYNDGKLHNLVILRLAPVYDRYWSLNLDRRVFAPKNLAYLRFGSGSQRMSALARLNLVEFIAHMLQSTDVSRKGAKDANIKNNTEITQSCEDTKREIISTDEIGLDSGFRRNDENESENDKGRNSQIFNVCDAESYVFNRIIGVFKKSGIQPNRPVISVPLSAVWFATRIAGFFFSSKREWIHSCYDKLASDLVFDNGRMMGTGFKPVHSLETIFDQQMVSRKGAKVKNNRKITQRRKDAKIKNNIKEIMTENEIAKIIVDSAFQIHKRLGPGLLESVYEIVLAHVLKKRGLKVGRQVPVAIVFEGIRFDEGFRADLIVGDKVIVELKSVEKVMPVHKKQLLTYLRLADKRLGLLINFGSELIRDGISRVVNGL